MDQLLLVYSLGFQLSFDMHEAIVKTISFLKVIQVIRGRKRSLEGQILNLLLLLYSLGSQLSFDMHKAIVEIFSICGGHQRSLEVIKVQFYFMIGISNPNQACTQKIGRFEPKMKAGPPPPTSNVPTPPSPLHIFLVKRINPALKPHLTSG